MKMTVGVLDHYNVSTRKEAAKRHLSEMRVSYHVNQVPNSAVADFSARSEQRRDRA